MEIHQFLSTLAFALYVTGHFTATIVIGGAKADGFRQKDRCRTTADVRFGSIADIRSVNSENRKAAVRRSFQIARLLHVVYSAGLHPM